MQEDSKIQHMRNLNGGNSHKTKHHSILRDISNILNIDWVEVFERMDKNKLKIMIVDKVSVYIKET